MSSDSHAALALNIPFSQLYHGSHCPDMPNAELSDRH